jgi:hypothetical protein
VSTGRRNNNNPKTAFSMLPYLYFFVNMHSAKWGWKGGGGEKAAKFVAK